MRTFTFTFGWLLAGTLFVSESLADWPQFRGPSGNGYLGELNHPTQWSMEENLAWSQPIPGGGCADHRWEPYFHHNSSGFQKHKATWACWRRSQHAR